MNTRGARAAYAAARGIRLHYLEAGEGPLVLLLHGFPEFWWSWRHQLEPLAAAGFRAVAVDLPGYGRSDKPDVTYDVEWLNGCLSGFIAALGHERAVLAGHDWGGVLAWPFARMHRERTAGVIGLNTPDLPRLPVPTTEFLRQSGSDRHGYILEFQKRGEAEDAIESDIDAFFAAIVLGAAVKREAFTEDVLRIYADEFRARGAITPPLEYYRNMDRNWELLEPYDDAVIDVPCLQICAEGDPFLPPQLATGMEERVPEVEIVTIPDSGHWTQQEQPQKTTEAMLSYLHRLPPWP